MISNLKWATNQLLNLAPLFFFCKKYINLDSHTQGLLLKYFLSVQSMLNPICAQPSAVRESQVNSFPVMASPKNTSTVLHNSQWWGPGSGAEKKAQK